MANDAYKANVLAGAERNTDEGGYQIGTLRENRLFACKRMHPDAKVLTRGEIVMLHERKGRGSDFSDYLFIISKSEQYGEVRGEAVEQVLTFSNRLSPKAFHDAVIRILRPTGGDVSKEALKAFAYE